MIQGTVKISLIKSDLSFEYTITTGHPYNESPVTYTIPLDAAAGTYFIKIEKEQGTVSGKSAEFTIK